MVVTKDTLATCVARIPKLCCNNSDQVAFVISDKEHVGIPIILQESVSTTFPLGIRQGSFETMRVDMSNQCERLHMNADTRSSLYYVPM